MRKRPIFDFGIMAKQAAKMSSIYTEDYLWVIRVLFQALINNGISQQQQLADVLKRPESFIAKIKNGK